MMKPRPLLLLVCLLVLAVAILPAGAASTDSLPVGNNQPAQQPPRQTSIAGRLITSDGSSPTGAAVVLKRLGEDIRTSRYQRIGPDGKFSFDSLAGGTYTLLTVDESSQDLRVDLDDDGSPALHQPGDFVELLIKREKPGVITGTVTGQSGEPIVEAIIQAIRVRDSDGNPNHSPLNLAAGNLQRKTDDRGVYRLWGLEPGSYLISAGGKSRGRSMLSAYDAETPTYYSDLSSGSPRPVQVGPGQEVPGIDIQYRGGSGHKVSGVFSGSYQRSAQSPQQSNQEDRQLAAVLTDTLTGEQYESRIGIQAAPPGSFAFSETPDGEYEIYVIAFGGPGTASEAASESKKISVKGADVSGIQLKSVTLGTISGRITLEPAPDLKPGCAPKKAPKLDQAALIFSRTGQPPAPPSWSLYSHSSMIEVRVDTQGNFPLTRLEPGPYRIKTYFPDDTLYLNSITLGAPSKPAPLGPLFSIKDAQQISTVIISLGMGAARLSGHILALPGGAALPAGLAVYLVPALAEHADNPLRFSTGRVRSGGAFVMAHIPPGRYRIIARPGSREGDQSIFESRDGRAALRREAERTGIALDLVTCQNLGNFALTYAPQ